MLLEACVTSARMARVAERAGAGRIELCARIEVGGLTPDAGLLEGARAAVTLPLHMMARPHDRGYVCDADTRRRLFDAIRQAQGGGANGVVLGALTPGGTVDMDVLGDLVAAARPLRVTFHRAFDLVPDPAEALEQLVAAGVDEVLTSGGAATAERGAVVLASLVRQAAGRIGIIAAGTVRGDNVRALVAATGVRAVHAHTDARGFNALNAALRDTP